MHRARPSRLKTFSYIGKYAYSLRFATANRAPVFTRGAIADLLIQQIQKTSADEGFEVLAYCVMPDHVHLLAGPRNRDASVGSLSATIKRTIRKRLRADWQWQPGCFDRLLRREELAEEKWEYIRENPVRAGLVSHWSDWPYRIGFEL